MITFSFAPVSAKDEELVLNGELTQGSLIRGQVSPGSTVRLNGRHVEVNSQGKFVIGFPRKAAQSHTLSWTDKKGESHERSLQLTLREYDIQRIDGLEPKMVTPPKEVTERIQNDRAKVSRARAEERDYDAVFTRFIWPADGPITGVYGSQRILNGEPKWPHYGVDVGSPEGSPVVAPAQGYVVLADDLYYSGNTIILDHGMGVFSTFLHLHTMDVKVGDLIEQGNQIGTIGSTGRSTGPHLDWRINLGQMRLDPALLVPPKN
ncbi:M23 family metallopeptidase [Alteromonas sp. ASW11-130]|uniref:M23 family metallopeptidase n=1 Tax=Alteromonas sp. ASW11-130 TaxID=3015775 RepID=UPI0022424D7D|nr:M23 family metallopeptidase [Alteromonas sp. ASW11-130]MCW8092225.1 M23 family metallopeptidase [Alteromonas sp. ASW11-130]